MLCALSLSSCTPPYDRYMDDGNRAMDKNEIEKAKGLFHKAVFEARKSTKAKANLVAALEAEAVCAENLKQYDDELKLLEEAAQACKSDPTLGAKRASKIHKRMGDIEVAKNDNDHAYLCYKSALEDLDSAGQSKSFAAGDVYVALGDMKANERSFKEARKYLEAGLQIMDEADEPRTYLQRGAAMNKLAAVYRELGMEDDAIALETEARGSQIGGTRGQIRKMLSGIPKP